MAVDLWGDLFSPGIRVCVGVGFGGVTEWTDMEKVIAMTASGIGLVCLGALLGKLAM